MSFPNRLKMLRKMRFISDQAGIINRYLREKSGWDPHLENSKRFILDSFSGKDIETIAILGSGWLLDVPLDELSERYKYVVLADIYHPPQIKQKIKRYSNIRLHMEDLSGGGIDFCWNLGRTGRKLQALPEIENMVLEVPVFPMQPDAFVSLNLLNQLDILLVEYLEMKRFSLPESWLRDFRRKIQDFHLAWITSHPGCLVTDSVEINLSADGTVTEKNLLFAELPGGRREQQWTWDFDLSGKYRDGMETRMKVRASEW